MYTDSELQTPICIYIYMVGMAVAAASNLSLHTNTLYYLPIDIHIIHIRKNK